MENIKWQTWNSTAENTISEKEKNDWTVFKRLDNAEKKPASLKTSEQEFSNWKRERKKIIEKISQIAVTCGTTSWLTLDNWSVRKKETMWGRIFFLSSVLNISLTYWKYFNPQIQVAQRTLKRKKYEEHHIYANDSPIAKTKR